MLWAMLLLFHNIYMHTYIHTFSRKHVGLLVSESQVYHIFYNLKKCFISMDVNFLVSSIEKYSLFHTQHNTRSHSGN